MTDTYPNVLVKLDAQGNLLWEQPFFDLNKNLSLESLQASNDGGFILAGSLYDSTNSSIHLIKTNQKGEQEWTNTFDQLNYNATTYRIISTSDQQFAIVGSGQLDMINTLHLRKIDVSILSTIPEFFPALNRLDLSPNPTTSQLTLSFNLKEAQSLTIQVVDLYGRTLQQMTTTKYFDAGDHQFNLSVDQLADGLYRLMIQNTKRSTGQTFLKTDTP